MDHSRELILRAHAASDSVESVRLEGLEPSRELLSDLDHWAAGELSLNEVGDRLFARIHAEDLPAQTLPTNAE